LNASSLGISFTEIIETNEIFFFFLKQAKPYTLIYGGLEMKVSEKVCPYTLVLKSILLKLMEAGGETS
jgi:hypothetical protein